MQNEWVVFYSFDVSAPNSRTQFDHDINDYLFGSDEDE
jgi:hypothetical protein